MLCLFEKTDRRIRIVGINIQNADINVGNSARNTIEFRCPNGTIDEVIWQNNINFFARLMEAIANNKIDLDYLDKRFNNLVLNNNIDSFNNIYIHDTLELADIIFDKDIDKLYFLKQYFKLFQEYMPSKKLEKIMKGKTHY